MALLPLPERERQLRVIEDGINKEFWKVLSASLERLAKAKMVDSVDFLNRGKVEEAKLAGAEYEAIMRVVQEPTFIIRANKPIFDQFIFKTCELCRNVVKILKPKETKSRTEATSESRP